MEIILHRCGTNGKINKKSLLRAVSSPEVDTIELDFVQAKNLEFVCSHSKMCDRGLISSLDKDEICKADLMFLEDILELVNGDKKVLLDFKDAPDRFFVIQHLWEIIKKYGFEDKVMIQSFNKEFIRSVLSLKKIGLFTEVEIGLIINLFKTFHYRNGMTNFNDLDFVSLSSELFEWPIVGNDYQSYRNMLPDTKQYAWTWAPPYTEKEERLINYIDSGVDGIITNDPIKVKKLLNK